MFSLGLATHEELATQVERIWALEVGRRIRNHIMQRNREVKAVSKGYNMEAYQILSALISHSKLLHCPEEVRTLRHYKWE